MRMETVAQTDGAGHFYLLFLGVQLLVDVPEVFGVKVVLPGTGRFRGGVLHGRLHGGIGHHVARGPIGEPQVDRSFEFTRHMTDRAGHGVEMRSGVRQPLFMGGQDLCVAPETDILG